MSRPMRPAAWAPCCFRCRGARRLFRRAGRCRDWRRIISAAAGFIAMNAIGPSQRSCAAASRRSLISPRRRRLPRVPYYQDFLGRHGLRWFAGVKVGEGEDVWALVLQRTIAQGPFSPDELSRLAELSRGLVGAATLARAFGSARIDAVLRAFEVEFGRRSPRSTAQAKSSGSIFRQSVCSDADLQVVKKRLVSFNRDATAALDRALHALIWTRGEAFHAPGSSAKAPWPPHHSVSLPIGRRGFLRIRGLCGIRHLCRSRRPLVGGRKSAREGLWAHACRGAAGRAVSGRGVARSGRGGPWNQHRHGAQPAQGRLSENGRAPAGRDHSPSFAPR